MNTTTWCIATALAVSVPWALLVWWLQRLRDRADARGVARARRETEATMGFLYAQNASLAQRLVEATGCRPMEVRISALTTGLDEGLGACDRQIEAMRGKASG